MTAVWRLLPGNNARVLIHPCEVDACASVAPFGFGKFWYCAEHKHLGEAAA
jgi:hypothetical protein